MNDQQPSTIIDFQAARAGRGLPAVVSSATAAFCIGQPVTVQGRPIRYGWVIGFAACPRTGTRSYTVQTPQGRIVCREGALRANAAVQEV